MEILRFSQPSWLSHLTLIIVVGLVAASLGAHAAHRGNGGWLAILVASTFLFVIGSMGTHIGLDLTYRVVSLGRYLRRYGFSGEGLTSESRQNEIVIQSAEPSDAPKSPVGRKV